VVQVRLSKIEARLVDRLSRFHQVQHGIQQGEAALIRFLLHEADKAYRSRKLKTVEHELEQQLTEK